jgi:hypothetical protein
VINVRQLRGWLARIFGLFQRGRREREFAEELESHLAMHIEDNLRAGMSPEEARRRALIKLGGMALTKERTREQGGLPMLETLWQDLRFGLRMLRKNPGFSFVAILTLALGIGANTAIFSVVNAILLRPLPYAEPEQLAQIYEANAQLNLARFDFSLPNFVDHRDQQTSFEQMAAYFRRDFNMTGAGEPERVQAAVVSASFLPLLRVQPMLGRAFLTEEEMPGKHRVVVLSHSLWQRRFGANPQIINQSVMLGGNAFTVVGVMPPRFQFPDPYARCYDARQRAL